jgi:hypothetical protein
MQIALTPFPKGVVVKQFLQDRKKRTKGSTAATSTTENSPNLGGGIPLLVGITGAGDDAPEFEHTATIQCVGIVSDPAGSVVSTEEHSQQFPFQVGNSRESFRVQGQTNPNQTVQLKILTSGLKDHRRRPEGGSIKIELGLYPKIELDAPIF